MRVHAGIASCVRLSSIGMVMSLCAVRRCVSTCRKIALHIHLFWAGPLRSHEATPDRAALRTNLRDCSHAKPIGLACNKTWLLSLMSAFRVKAEPISRGRILQAAPRLAGADTAAR